MTKLYFVTGHQKIRVYNPVEATETPKQYKLYDAEIYGRNTFKKSDEMKLIEGIMYDSYMIFTTDETKVDEMQEMVRKRIIASHERLIEKSQEVIKSIQKDAEIKTAF